MDDITVEDDKKRFDPEVPHDEDTQPDPDEELMLDRGNGRVWMVKVSINPIYLEHGCRDETSLVLCTFEESFSYGLLKDT